MKWVTEVGLMGGVCVHRASPPELHLIFVFWKLLWELCRTEQNQQGIGHILSRGDGSSAPKPEELPFWNLGGEQTRLWSGVLLLEDPSPSSLGAQGFGPMTDLCSHSFWEIPWLLGKCHVNHQCFSLLKLVSLSSLYLLGLSTSVSPHHLSVLMNT